MVKTERNDGRVRAPRGQHAACALAVLMMLMMLLPAPVTADIIDDERQTVFIERQYSWPAFTDDEGYDRVSVNGLNMSRMNDVPYALPVDSVVVSIPAGELSDLQIRYHTSESLYLGVYALEPVLVSDGTSTVLHGSNYQRTEHLNQNGLYQRPNDNVLYLSLSPLSYDPSTGETYYVQKISVTVSYVLEEASRTPGLTSVGDDLLIITSDAMESQFQRLANWKESLGFDVQLVTTAAILGGAPISAEAIKSYISAQHNISSIEYVLLGGDQSVIPAWHVELTIPIAQPHESVVSDLYYASFNYDVDWSTGISPFYDLSIGRLPFNAVGQVSNYIDKLIRYESRDYPDLYDEVLFLGERMDNDPVTWGGDGKDSNLIYVPTGYNVTTLYERDIGYPAVRMNFSMVHDALEGGAHIVNDLSHGNFDNLLDLTSANILQVDNPIPYIWFSQACQIGGFDQTPNIAKSMLADENNAVALVAHSREGFYMPGDAAAGQSNLFDNSYMSFLFNDTLLLGDVLRLSKEVKAGDIGDPFTKWVYAELNLLGDPTLKVGGYEILPPSSLHIDDNDDLINTAALRGWAGDGSFGDPFVVEGYQLRNNDYQECLYIANTTLHAVIQNNGIVQSIPAQNGMALKNTSNISVLNNSFSNKNIGLHVTDSSEIVVEGNIFQSNAFAIYLQDCSDCIIQRNILVRDNGQGITLDAVSSSHLLENIVSRCSGAGVSVSGDTVTISGNSLYLNNGSSLFTSVPQAYNSGTNDWDGNFWFLSTGPTYALAGSGSDLATLGSDPFDAPVFNTVVLDAMQNGEVDPLTRFNFTAVFSGGAGSYQLSVNGNEPQPSSPDVRAGELGLLHGWNELSMLAFSSDGTVANYALTVNYTSAGISVDISAPNSYFLSTDRVTVRWVSADAINVSYYELRIDDGDWLNMSRTTRYTTPALSEGLHVIEVRAVAHDGGTDVDNRHIFVDTSAPTLFIQDISEGMLLKGNQISLNWTVSDAHPSSGISHFTLKIDSSTVISIENSSTRSYTMPLAEGRHRITLRAYDNAGNYRDAQVNVLVDSEAPVITFIPSPDYPYYRSDLQVNWTVSDLGSGVASTHIRINRGVWIDVTGKNSHIFPNLPDGYYAIEMKAWDLAGHLSMAHHDAVVSQTEAVLDFINPHSGGYSKSPDVFSWNVWDKRGYSYTYRYSLDGASFVDLGSESEVNLSLLNGPHSILVKATCVETGAHMERATSFITLEFAQAPIWTDPAQSEPEFLFDRPIRAGFALAMLVDRDLSTMVLRDSEDSIVPGMTIWSSNGTMSFYPSGKLDYPAQYRLSIKVVDVAGNTLTYPLVFSTKEVSLPGAPQNLTVDYNPSWDGVYLSLEWSEPLQDGGYPTEQSPLQYNVYRRSNSTDFTLLATLTDTRYEDHQVDWDDYFIYYVTAVNPVGEGPATELALAGLPVEPDIWAKIGLFLEHVQEVIDLFLADAGVYLGMIGDQLSQYIDMAVAAVMGFLEDLSNSIIEGINSFVDGLIDFLNGLGDAIISFLDALGQFVIDLTDRLIETSPEDRLFLLFIIFLLAVLVMLLRMDNEHRVSPSKSNEVEKPRYPIEKDAEGKVLELVVPRSVNAAISEQNGRLIMEEISELESAYQEGLVGWQDYEMALAEYSANLSAVTLASFFTQVSEDIF